MKFKTLTQCYVFLDGGVIKLCNIYSLISCFDKVSNVILEALGFSSALTYYAFDHVLQLCRQPDAFCGRTLNSQVLRF